MKNILKLLSNTFFAKRGWMHFTGTIAILYKISIWFGWYEFTRDSKIAACIFGGSFVGLIINVGIEFGQEKLVKIKLKDPFAKSAQKSDVYWGGFAGPFGVLLSMINQNLSVAAYITLIILVVLETRRIFFKK